MKFWDSSALVCLLVEQSGSAAAKTLIRRDPKICVWWNTKIEIASALARLEREGLDPRIFRRAMERLATFASTWFEILPGEAIRDTAIRLLRLHPLRAADALQLAAAINAAEQKPANLDLVSLDDKLSSAALREGFRVFPEPV